MKRKLAYDLSSDVEDDFIPRPAKRLTMCHNTPKQARDEKKRLLKTSRKKLKQFTHPESNLHRSVLINNVYRKLQSELKQNKPARSYGYAFNPKCPFGYGAGPKEVANRQKLAKLREVLDKKGSEATRIVGDRCTSQGDVLERTHFTESEVTCLRNAAIKKCASENGDITSKEFLSRCDNNNTSSVVAMDDQTIECHMTEENSDTEEIDVCTVDDNMDTLLTPSNNFYQGLNHSEAGLGMAHAKVVNNTSTSEYGNTPVDCKGSLMSEQASLGEVSSRITEAFYPEMASYTTDTEPNIQPYTSQTGSLYTSNIHPICLSQYYMPIIPQGYLSPAYCQNLSRLYPGFPVQGTTPVVTPQIHHPSARTVTCT